MQVNGDRSAIELTSCESRVGDLLTELSDQNCRRVDRMFAVLMILQWIGGVLLAVTVSPATWIGATSSVHVHVWAAFFLGGLIAALPIAMVQWMPGRQSTRFVMAIAQTAFSALLIHLSGGRIETHFHAFGSLAFLALYRDWRVLMVATAVLSFDHYVRGTWWPLSVYGVALESELRWVEHAAWVLFEVTFLTIACIRGQNELKLTCQRHAALEQLNRDFESTVNQRTSELDDAKKFFRSVLDSVDSQVCIVDRDGVIVATNARWDYYTSETGMEGLMAGQNYLEACRRSVFGKESAKLITSAVESVLIEGQQRATTEYEHRWNHESRWYQVSVTPLQSHERGSAVVVHTSITERVETQRELREKTREAETLAMVAKHADASVVITDGSGRIEWVNESFSKLTELAPSDAEGIPIYDLLNPEQSDRTADADMKNAIQLQNGFDDEILYYAPSDTAYWLAVEMRPIQEEHGDVLKYIVIGHDITERKRSESDLAEASRHAGMAEVATGVLHNVGNVLNSVNVSANILMKCLRESRVDMLSKTAGVINDHRDDLGTFFTTDQRGKHFPDLINAMAKCFEEDRSVQEEELNSLHSNIEHIKTIVSMQQGYSRSGGTETVVNIVDLIEQSIRINESSLQRSKIEIIRRFEDVPDVTTDRHYVIQILVNLITNARNAIVENESSRRQINIGLRKHMQGLQIEVTDSGVGISKDDLPKIFKHGFTTREKGHGFGLHSCAIAAKQLGGSLSAKSKGLGHGTTFTLRLPVTSREANSQITEHATTNQHLDLNSMEGQSR